MEINQSPQDLNSLTIFLGKASFHQLYQTSTAVGNIVGLHWCKFTILVGNEIGKSKRFCLLKGEYKVVEVITHAQCTPLLSAVIRDRQPLLMVKFQIKYHKQYILQLIICSLHNIVQQSQIKNYDKYFKDKTCSYQNLSFTLAYATKIKTYVQDISYIKI